MNEMILQYEYYMSKAIELAERAKGQTSPNPLVGAVIVNSEGTLIAEGFHEKAGCPHAEVVALREASADNLKGSTLFVNLEPCCHYGKTPPCAKAIIEAGISKVVIGSLDPNPKVSGGGIKALQEAGISVISGVLERQCAELNRFFFHWIQNKKPWVSLKIAATLDGKISIEPHGKWITGLEARKQVHKLRSEFDAVLTGSGTIMADDPQLTVRLAEGRNPVRVVLDRRLRCDKDKRVFQEDGLVLLFTGSMEKAHQKGFQQANIEIIEWDGNLMSMLSQLAERNILSVMVEAGNVVNSSFIRENAFNELLYFVNPSLFGGSMSVNSSDELFTKLTLQSVKKYDKDLLFILHPLTTGQKQLNEINERLNCV